MSFLHYKHFLHTGSRYLCVSFSLCLFVYVSVFLLVCASVCPGVSACLLVVFLSLFYGQFFLVCCYFNISETRRKINENNALTICSMFQTYNTGSTTINLNLNFISIKHTLFHVLPTLSVLRIQN